MKNIKERMEAAWQKSRGEESYNSDYPVKASQNFTDGYCAGMKDALTNLWHNLEVETPAKDGDYITLLKSNKNNAEGCIIIEIAPWRNGVYQGSHYMGVYMGCTKATHWMPIPQINEIKE